MSKVTKTLGVVLGKSDAGKTVYGVPHGTNRWISGKVEEYQLYHVRGPAWGKFMHKHGTHYETLRLDDGNSEFMFKNRGNRSGYFWFRDKESADKCNEELNVKASEN